MKRFSIEKVLQVLITQPITSLHASPTFIRSLLKDPNFPSHSFKNLRIVSSGGEALSGEIIQQWKERTGLYLLIFYFQRILKISDLRCVLGLLQ